MITGVLSDVGQGKTQIIVYFAHIDAVKYNRKVFTNIELKFPNTFPLDINDLLAKKNWEKLEGSTIIFDDVDEYLDNRSSPSKRNKILSYFSWSHRKLEVDVYYTAHQLDYEMLRTHEVRLHNYTNRFLYPFAVRKNQLNYKEVPLQIEYDMYVRDSKGKMTQLPSLILKHDDIIKIGALYNTREIIIDSRELQQESIPDNLLGRL